MKISVYCRIVLYPHSPFFLLSIGYWRARRKHLLDMVRHFHNLASILIFSVSYQVKLTNVLLFRFVQAGGERELHDTFRNLDGESASSWSIGTSN